VGRVVTNVFGKRFLLKIEEFLEQIPIVNLVYKTIKQITETLSAPNKQAFKKVIMIEYPRKDLWTMSMVTGESKDINGNEYYHIFVPTTPNPTSGYMIFAKKNDVVETELTVEEGMRIIISGGLLAPEINSVITNNE